MLTTATLLVLAFAIIAGSAHARDLSPREKKDAAVQFLKSLESKDSKALKYVDLDKYIQHTCMPRTACLSFAKTAHGVFAVTCLCRCSGPCHRSLRSIQGIPELPLGCKATYAPRPGPSDF